MTPDNPYSSPVIEPPAEIPARAQLDSFGVIARETFLAWEKLRLVYVGVLAVVTLLLGVAEASTLIVSFRFWLVVVEGAVVANVCFFAGPIVETYVTWLGFRSKWLRIAMFVLGTLFSCLLAFGVIASQLLPGMN